MKVQDMIAWEVGQRFHYDGQKAEVTWIEYKEELHSVEIKGKLLNTTVKHFAMEFEIEGPHHVSAFYYEDSYKRVCLRTMNMSLELPLYTV